ncbi:MAG: ATP-binding cassette domain-containing protein [Chthoniobacterales bacterium]|nr:ATP-binding cassette domain-containing protein [Chthoniobacterales bacterium]
MHPTDPAAAARGTNGATASPPPHLSIKGLGLKRNDRWLFRNLNWEVPRGSVIAVVGPSGVGKSSLLNCLAGLTNPTEGELTFSCNAGCLHQAGDYQKRVGIIFQNLLLAENSSVLKNVLCGRLGRYPWWKTLFHFPRRDKEDAAYLLTDLGLGPYLHKRAAEISGGEQQRAAIARALFQEPELLLADEPVSNLDAYLCGRVLGILRQEAHQKKRTVFCVLHDPALLERFADYALSLDPMNPEKWRIREIHAASSLN